MKRFACLDAAQKFLRARSDVTGQHGFWLWVDRDPATSTAPAADAWQRLVRYLRETLGGAN